MAQRRFFNIQSGLPAEEGTAELSLRLKCEGDDLPLPASVPRSRTFKHDPVVLLRPLYPANVGHFLIDDVFGAFALVFAFGFNPTRYHLTVSRTCADFYPAETEEAHRQRCLSFHDEWTPVLTGSSLVRLGSAALAVENLFVGVASTSVREFRGAGPAWLAFRRHILTRLHLADDSPSSINRRPAAGAAGSSSSSNIVV